MLFHRYFLSLAAMQCIIKFFSTFFVRIINFAHLFTVYRRKVRYFSHFSKINCEFELKLQNMDINEKYHPTLRIRFSLRNIKRDENMLSLPIFLADWLGHYNLSH